MSEESVINKKVFIIVLCMVIRPVCNNSIEKTKVYPNLDVYMEICINLAYVLLPHDFMVRYPFFKYILIDTTTMVID